MILDINVSRASLAEGVAAQLLVRAGNDPCTKRSFGVLRTLPGSERSVSPMLKPEDTFHVFFHGSPGRLLRMENCPPSC